MRLFAVALLGLGCALVAARPMDVQTVLRADNDMLSANFALASPVEAFDLWLQRYNKDYVNDPREKATRLGVFKSNAATIAAHNANPASTFLMALNEFADLTFQEFAATRLGFNLSLADGLLSNGNANAATPFRYEDVDVADLPKSIDWRERGAVTPVKNQGMCGSCWAFSATGAIEGINAIQTGKLVSLSEQQLVSCDTAKDMGCGGGLMDYAFEYVVKNGGIDTEEDYGYWSWGLPCQHRREHDRPAVTIESYEDVPPADADSLKKALAHQPVSVAICANSNLQFYSSGVVKEKSCCQELNHGVLAVGYDDGEGSWLVKNSWGASWGEKGFFRVAREASNPNGVCGILQAASYPVKESTTNPEVPEICGFFGFTECPLRQSCQCNWSFFGLFCLNWGCVKPHSAEL